MDITEVSMIHHVGIVLVLLWVLSYFNCSHVVVYIISLFYLYQVHEHYMLRLRKKLQYEERKYANQKRMLSDSETVRWLNGAVEKIWPICMEQIASQKILLPIVPWFLEKFKPWTAKEALVESLYLGRNPPMFTEIRVLSQYSSDDHVVLELGMNFLAADDMSALLAVKVIGVGMRAKLHMTGMHIEGKVIVGVKFLRDWPYLGRMRVCFSEPPYFQMTVKPIFNHGIDVTEIPGIAGWIDKLLAVAFEQTLVEPNMLVVDVEKFVSSPTDTWFSVDEKDPIAYAVVEIIEGADMKPSDLNGFSDPYVKGQVGTYKFRTKVQKKTLTPKWYEEFKIPICTWESLNLLSIEVCDKDHLYDDTLGKCSININELRGESRRAFWLPLQNIKMGSLHLAITVIDAERKMEKGSNVDEKQSNKIENINSNSSETSQRVSTQTTSSKKGPKLADDFEPINIEGQTQTGIWVHHPGSDVSETWEPRKGRKSRLSDIKIHREDNDSTCTNSHQSPTLGSNQSDASSSDESSKGSKPKPLGAIRRSLQKIGSAFHRSPKTPRKENSSILGEAVSSDTKSKTDDEISVTSEESKEEDIASPDKGSGKKSFRKSIIKHAERSANGIKKRVSRKAANKRTTDSGTSATNMETLQGPESPGTESLSSSTEDIPITDNRLESASLTFSGEAFVVTNEPNIKQAFLDDSEIKMEEPPVREIHLPGVVKADDDGTFIHSDVSREIQIEESLNRNYPEKSSETEKMEKVQMEKPIE